MGRSNINRQDTPKRFKSKAESLQLRFLPGILWLVLSLACLTSCEKVIHLDLNNTTPMVVIQGNIYDHPGPYLVTISKTVNFEESNTYPPVTGAKVEISDNGGQRETLTESGSGTYKTSRLKGIAGRTYTLTVTTGEQTYQSVATMPYPVQPDSIYCGVNPFSGEKVTTIRFMDPPAVSNYYRLVYFINNIQQKNFYTLDDELFQGAIIRYALQSRDSEIKLLKGDQVTVWLESIDQGVYEYFRTAGRESGQSASPSNPVSNLTNGALGYFNASSVRKIALVIDK